LLCVTTFPSTGFLLEGVLAGEVDLSTADFLLILKSDFTLSLNDFYLFSIFGSTLIYDSKSALSPPVVFSVNLTYLSQNLL
jgi:hypothetical protein